MSEAKPRGRFIWFDLMTTDPAKAVEFYTSVVGWGTTQWEGSAPYTMWTSASVPIGGVMQLPPEAGAPPHWLAYISSPDVDATAQQAESLGRESAGGAERRADGGPLRGPERSARRRVRDLHAAGGGAGARGPARGAASSRGTSWRRANNPRRSVSTRRCSAGTRRQRWTWGRWGTTRCSAATMSSWAACSTSGPRCPARRRGRTTSWSTTSTAPSRRQRPAAGRSSTVRWKCPAATGSSRASTRRARCSPCTRRGRRQSSEQLPATSYQPFAGSAGAGGSGPSSRLTTPTCRTPAHAGS